MPVSAVGLNGSRLPEFIARHRPDLNKYEKIRTHLHEYPELSKQEFATAAFVISHLKSLQVYDIHGNIGGFGIAAVFYNGQGKTILLRADMDALPVLEQTGLPYASKVIMRDDDGVMKPCMHACGHDVHVTCLLACAESMVAMRNAWSGTLVLVFQPDEERSGGAHKMVVDGLYEKVPVPDFVLGQHVMPMKSGRLGTRIGTVMAASDSMHVTFFGRGGHASMPNVTIDPVVMMASCITRLQTIVSRETDPSKEVAVVTIGSVRAGDAENIIPDQAEMKVNVRTIDRKTREKVLEAIKRIIHAEGKASGATRDPEVETTSSFPATINDEAVTRKVSQAFNLMFENNFEPDLPRVNGSEDFSILASSIGKPYMFWFIGGTNPDLWDEAEKNGTLEKDIPVNHSAKFAPVMRPTIPTGTDALCLAAMTLLIDT